MLRLFAVLRGRTALLFAEDLGKVIPVRDAHIAGNFFHGHGGAFQQVTGNGYPPGSNIMAQGLAGLLPEAMGNIPGGKV